MPQNNYNGKERREDYCPVHHIKCKQLNDLESDVKNRLPRWVFLTFIGLMTSMLGYMNYQILDSQQDALMRQERLQSVLNVHLEESNRIFTRINHNINEVAVNQQRVLEKLDMPFRPIPRYDQNHGPRK